MIIDLTFSITARDDPIGATKVFVGTGRFVIWEVQQDEHSFEGEERRFRPIIVH